MKTHKILDLMLSHFYELNRTRTQVSVKYHENEQLQINNPPRDKYKLDDESEKVKYKYPELNNFNIVKDFDLYWNKLIVDGYLEKVEGTEGEVDDEWYTITLDGMLFKDQGGYCRKSLYQKLSSLSQLLALWLATLAAVVAAVYSALVYHGSYEVKILYSPIAFLVVGIVLGLIVSRLIKLLR